MKDSKLKGIFVCVKLAAAANQCVEEMKPCLLSRRRRLRIEATGTLGVLHSILKALVSCLFSHRKGELVAVKQLFCVYPPCLI